MTSSPVIAGAARSPYARHPTVGTTTESLLVDASMRAVADAGFAPSEVDGIALASFTLGPDHAIDLAWRLGMTLRWIMEDTNGGASGVNMLQHAARAIAAGDASVVVLVAGDRLLRREFIALTDNYNKASRDHLAALPLGGPNALFAALTQRHMERHGLERQDYGWVAIGQRRWAGGNPGAVYRRPLSMDEYLSAPAVAPPLGRYDCVPVVSGADALVVAARERVAGASVGIRAVDGLHNPDHQDGDGLRTGLAEIADRLWSEAGLEPTDVDLASIYDDYPVMVLVQAADLGLIPDGDVRRFVHARLRDGDWPLNTSGGQLSAGQAGAGGGLHGLVEAATQLRWRAGERQVAEARTAVVTGYGMVLYRYGACANAAVLERLA